MHSTDDSLIDRDLAPLSPYYKTIWKSTICLKELEKYRGFEMKANHMYSTDDSLIDRDLAPLGEARRRGQKQRLTQSSSFVTNTVDTNKCDTNICDTNTVDTNTVATNTVDTNTFVTNTVDVNTFVTNTVDTNTKKKGDRSNGSHNHDQSRRMFWQG